MTTTLDTLRSIVTDSALQVVSDRFSATQIDHAIQAAGSEFARRTRCLVASDDSLSLTVGSATLDYSSVTAFAPSRFVAAALLYPGGEAWATATAYTEHDLVTNDGLMYVATQDHTSGASTEPGTGDDEADYWSEVDTDVAHLLGQADYRHVARRLKRGEGVCDRPQIAFRPEASQATVSFSPEVAWRVRLAYWDNFTTWTIGTVTPADITLNIPDEHIYPVAWFGAPSYLIMGKAPEQAANLRAQFEHHLRIAAGQVGTTGPVYADEDAYL